MAHYASRSQRHHPRTLQVIGDSRLAANSEKARHSTFSSASSSQRKCRRTQIPLLYTQCGGAAYVTNGGVSPYLIEQGDYNCPYRGETSLLAGFGNPKRGSLSTTT